jgi:hypothetical protein
MEAMLPAEVFWRFIKPLQRIMMLIAQQPTT